MDIAVSTPPGVFWRSCCIDVLTQIAAATKARPAHRFGAL